MNKYICTDCNTEFEEPFIIIERHGLEAPPYEHIEVCPECHSSDFEEII